MAAGRCLRAALAATLALGCLPSAQGFATRLQRVNVERPDAAAAALRADTGLMSWQAASSMAADVASRMDSSELMSLAHGVHFRFATISPEQGYYTGNTDPIPRFNIPALKMQDAGQGFRPTEPKEAGTTTSFPCLLTLASSWDEDLVQRVASAIGQEFAGKGANVMLGPSVNVHRVARNGRNFEYLSGEDPYLGARLVYPFITGVQAQGVMATVKHYAFNEQETNRMLQNSVVDERTAWELYYPPFEAAVKAGAGAFMCSYNRVNGTYACENDGVLVRDLRQGMGFRGLVMSDWYATHSRGALAHGLDQEMPGTDNTVGGNTVSHVTLQKVRTLPDSDRVLRQVAGNVLTAVYRLRLHERPGCLPPHCDAERASNQRSAAHSAVAREAATNGVVLLKNEGSLLPLDASSVKTLHVSGPAANPPSVPNGLAADYYAGGGSGHVPVPQVTTPLEAIRQRAEAAGISMVQDAASADACIVIMGTTASEGMDRPNLNLDGEVAISAVAHSCRRTAVLMQTPGAVLTDWRGQVAAIANLFLAGEETAAAWAAVLFGDVTPSGKLPITMPASQSDTIPPGWMLDVRYSEGLYTSYRSPTFKAAFPFGHGLSYAQFEYSAPEVQQGCAQAACVAVTVTNAAGSRHAGREIAQAYLSFSSEAQEPKMVLRGFRKTRLLRPGESERLVFELQPRDVSAYRVGAGWLPQGAVEVHIGASSADIRHVVSVSPRIV